MQFSVWYNIDNERNKKQEKVIIMTRKEQNIILVSLAKTLNILQKGGTTNGNA